MGHENGNEIDRLPEARIVAEDDIQTIVAFRIDKAWLARNIHFLAALADCATEPITAPLT